MPFPLFPLFPARRYSNRHRSPVYIVPRILLIQGPNMRTLGTRQPEIYGTVTAQQLDARLRAHAKRRRYTLDIAYTSHDGEAIAHLQRASEQNCDGLVMNPAGFVYGSHALRDCLRALPFPYIEVHISNIEQRGFGSVLAAAAVGMIAGFGLHSYELGLEAMLHHLCAPPPLQAPFQAPFQAPLPQSS